MKLFDLTREYLAILEDIDAADGVLDAELEARLDAIGGTYTDKVDAVASVIRTFETQADAAMAESKRLAERAKAASNSADHLMDYLFGSMKATGHTKIKGVRFTVSIAKNPAALKLVEGAVIPDAWTVVVPESRKPDTASIKAALAGGASLPFATLTRGERLAIK